MLTLQKRQEFYRAFSQKNSQYVGLFFVGVTSTGIFCHPTCPARTPKFENCEFFEHADEALAAGFRPCKRCHPLKFPQQTSQLIQTLINEIAQNPEKRWSENDLQQFQLDSSTVRRQFKKRFGLTFLEYARSRRLVFAREQIRGGERVMEAQLTTGYESGSGFRAAFGKIMGGAPSQSKEIQLLKAAWLDTPLGPMIALADEDSLHLLEFMDRKKTEQKIQQLKMRNNAALVPGTSAPLISIKEELDQYFRGTLKTFMTKTVFQGTDFQKSVWEELKKIPFGETRSYADLAKSIGNPLAVRAVGGANGMNCLAIIVPCHRVINTSGALGGYAGGIGRKEWLLKHEKKPRN